MWFQFSRKVPHSRPARRTSATPKLSVKNLEDRCLLSAGVLDPTFGSGGIVTTALTRNNDGNNGVLLQMNGNMIAYGGYADRSGPHVELARYTPSGSLDSTFGSGGIVTTKISAGGTLAATLQSDGKILVAGSKQLIRYNSNGSLDTTFGSKGIATYPSGFDGCSVVIQPSTGGIVVGGNPFSGTGSVFELLRYTPTGKLDSTFGTNGEVTTSFPGYNAAPNCLALENGDIVAAGDAVSTTNVHLWALARYTANGSLDPTFGSSGLVVTPVGYGGAGTEVTSLLVQPNGHMVAVGNAQDATNTYDEWGLARYDTSGHLDNAFGSGGIVTSHFSSNGDDSYCSALQANGQIVVGGVGSSGANRIFEIGRYNADGTPDTTFGSGGVVSTASGTSAAGLAIQTDGKIVATGLAVVNGKNEFMLARYLASEPETGSFAVSQSVPGGQVTFTASSVTDGNPNSTVSQLTFYYYDSSGNKITVGAVSAPDGSGNWTLSASLAPGTYTFYAQAEDNYGVFDDPVAVALTVQ